MKVKKGDQIKVISGKDRGKKGKIIRCLPGKSAVVVENINIVKKHRKAQRKNEKGERISLPMPISVSNVQLVCPKCNKATRVGSKQLGDKKTRICKKCQSELE